MENFTSRIHRFVLIAAYSLACSFATSGFGQEASGGSKAPATSGQHTDVKLSEPLHTEDRISAKLTVGQKKAVAGAKSLESGSAAIFRPDGTVLQKGPAKELNSAFKACKELKPISDKCWLCKDNGTILCSTSLKPDSSERHVTPDSK
jgi:hypothetical protein